MTGHHELPALYGRTSSHFTRVARIVALELGVPVALHVVRDLRSTDVADYGGNPALKVPSLVTPEGSWFGALNVCRELYRRSDRTRRVVWPEHHEAALLANAQELVQHAMSAEVALLMSRFSEQPEGRHEAKLRRGLDNCLAWLERHAAEARELLPGDRDLSFFEVTLYCLMTHLEFRQVAPTEGYPRLNAFCVEFAARPAVAATAFAMDA